MDKPALTLYLDFGDGRRAEVCLTMICDPWQPTPNEKEIVRQPLFHEYAEIVKRLGTMDITRMEVAG